MTARPALGAALASKPDADDRPCCRCLRRRGSQAATHIDAIDPRFGILPDVNALIGGGELPGPEINGALVTDDLLESFAGGDNRIEQDIEGVRNLRQGFRPP